MEMLPKYPDVAVQLSGEDGNAGSMIARTSKALKKAGVAWEVIQEFRVEAISGDYDHVLQTIMRWVETS